MAAGRGSRNELEPRVLTIADDAAASWRAFYNRIERQCGPGKDLRPVQDFAAKIAEHAARIGVLTIVDDFRATTIGVEAIHSALTLADWYMNEAVRLEQAPAPIRNFWRLDGKPVRRLSDLTDQLEQVGAGKGVRLTLKRGSNVRDVNVDIVDIGRS